MTALLEPDETLALGVNVIVRPGDDRPTEPVGGTCDWGDCQFWAITRRWSEKHGWLPVCERHADRYGVAPPQDWVALTGPCPTCDGLRWTLTTSCCGYHEMVTHRATWDEVDAIRQSFTDRPEGHDRVGIVTECSDCRDGRRIVPLYRETEAGKWPQCDYPNGVLVGRGSIEVVPVVRYREWDGRSDTPVVLIVGGTEVRLWHGRLHDPLSLDPLPVPGRDFGVVIDVVELA